MDEQQLVETIEAPVANFIKENPYLIIGASAVLGACAGLVVGYRLAKRHLEPKYAAIAENEIREARDHYRTLAKEGYSTPEDAVKALIPAEEQEALEAHHVYAGHKVVEIEETADGVTLRATVDNEENPVEHRNIFVDNQPLNPDDWDYDRELEQRTEDEPYIIHEDEFNENEPDYSDISLTYYAGDGILANEEDERVDDVQGLVGERNLKKFGHGSRDRNMLYVRNNKRGLNIEIARSGKSYSHEVLGMEEEPELEARMRRRQRLGD